MEKEGAAKVARTARLEMSDEELERLAAESAEILEWAEQLEGIEEEDPIIEPGGTRDDIPRGCGDAVRDNFPSEKNGKLEVPESL